MGRRKGFIPLNKIDWTPERDQYLIDNFHRMTNPQLAKGLGLKLTSVRTRCYELGLKRMELEYWTERQVEFLLAHYKTIGDKELALIFEEAWPKNKGWTLKHIEKKRRYLGLKRTAAEKRAIHVRNMFFGSGKLANKKLWDSRGVTPVGEVRMWQQTGSPFLVIKLEHGFVHYKQWLYEQLYGEVPEGHVVVCKDGDPLNVVPDNLEVISRGEHASRNSKSRAQYPEELKELIKLNNKLKKAIDATANREEVTEHAQ